MRSKLIGLGLMAAILALMALVPVLQDAAANAAGARIREASAAAPYTFDGQRIVLR